MAIYSNILSILCYNYEQLSLINVENSILLDCAFYDRRGNNTVGILPCAQFLSEKFKTKINHISVYRIGQILLVPPDYFCISKT